PTSIDLGTITGVTFYSDGMRIQKEAGTDQIFTFSGDIDMLRLITDSLMTTHRQESPLRSDQSTGAGPRSGRSERKESSSRTVVQQGSSKSPYAVLGIAVSASTEEIKIAYRKMASLYHPDKVAHLAPEFREMADRKMKEINTAYGSIKSKYCVSFGSCAHQFKNKQAQNKTGPAPKLNFGLAGPRTRLPFNLIFSFPILDDLTLLVQLSNRGRNHAIV